jgi:hypothetical protein
MKDLAHLKGLYHIYNLSPQPAADATFGHRIMDWFFPAFGINTQGLANVSAAGVRILPYLTNNHQDNIYYWVFNALNGYQAAPTARNGDILVLNLYEISHFQFGTTFQGVAGPPTQPALYFSLSVYHKGSDPTKVQPFSSTSGVIDLGYDPTVWIPAQCGSPVSSGCSR